MRGKENLERESTNLHANRKGGERERESTKKVMSERGQGEVYNERKSYLRRLLYTCVFAWAKTPVRI